MKKGNNKIKNKWFLVAAICYYISSVALFIANDSRSMAITNLLLGSCMLALSFSNTEKDKK